MDRMQLWELVFLLENYIWEHRQSWEQTRKIMWACLQSNSPKKIPSGHNLFPLWYDKEDGDIVNIDDTDRINKEFEMTKMIGNMLKK